MALPRRPAQLWGVLALCFVFQMRACALQLVQPRPERGIIIASSRSHVTRPNRSTSSRREAIEETGLAFHAGLFPLLTMPSPARAIYENAPVRTPSSPGIVTLPSGVSLEDLRVGPDDAPVVSPGKRVNVQWVLKRSNGYFVDSSERNGGVPFIFTVGDPRGAIAGLDEGIRGMRVGSIRRIVIPPQLAYVDGVDDGKPGPVPNGFGPKQRMRRVMELLKEIPGEAIVLDVKATRVQ